MHRLILLFLLAIIALVIPFNAPAWSINLPQNLSQMAVIPFPKAVFAGHPPNNLGVHEGKLAPCPASPNCVLSQSTDDKHIISPINYYGDRDAAKKNLLRVLSVVPRTKIVEQTDNYIHAESSSRIMGFVDDVEFYFPDSEKIVHIRSASRLGESDLGVNRRRLEQIRLALRELNKGNGE